MAIKEILEFIGQENIADDLEPDVLSDLGREVKRRFDEDWQSMQEWMDSVDHGVKLMKQEFNTKSTPWDGASNFKSPILSEASISFGDKATLEILRRSPAMSVSQRCRRTGLVLDMRCSAQRHGGSCVQTLSSTRVTRAC